jgi:hypothetical protein
MLEDNYGRTVFRIGAVRLTVDRFRHQSLRRLRGQALTTARFMGENLDDLSEHLGAEYQPDVDTVLAALGAFDLPATYREVVTQARRAFDVYSDLLDAIAEREAFDVDE